MKTTTTNNTTTNNTTTTTNNNIRKVYDVRSIMGRAWEIRREAAAEMGCRVSSVLMSECLKIAWAEAEAINAPANAAAVVKAWGDMNEAAQVKMMTACIRKAAKNEIGYSVEDRYLQFSEVPAWALYGHGFDEFVNETWLRVAGSLDVDQLTAKNERLAVKGERPITLATVVYNAARASIAAIFYEDSKHAAAHDWDVIDDNGNIESYVETRCSSDAYNTENAAIIRADIRRFTKTRDEKDKAILEGMISGLTEREIAPRVGISNVAVHKRIVKMRDALREMTA